MAKYQIIYWRDIPVQVRVKVGRKRQTQPLPDIFQKTVHRAAYRGKAISGDAYTDGYEPTKWKEREGESEAVLAAVTAEIVADYSAERLNNLALNKGHEPT